MASIERGPDFIRAIVERHLAEGRYREVVTRFPPEPNGYLHIGHAQAIGVDFGIAREFGGRCHLRFDDTNPITEEGRYAAAMQEDIRWLGHDWGEHLYYASDYFERMYEAGRTLIRKGKAYVDSQTEEEIRAGRGTVTEPGVPSPYRDRSVEENLDLFARMRAGEFPDGAHVLRGKIDMASPNMVMRDPVFYRIRHAHHYRTGDDWCIYPLYDFAHCLEDAFEGITHSICTLEFENNREIYDWILDEVGFEEPRTHQYEFARLNIEYTLLSKRKLIRLVNEGHVSGWDDPRMPTVAGLRRRGVTPEAIQAFVQMVGVTKVDARTDFGKLEYAIRDDLNRRAPRVMAVLRPLKVVITNFPEGRVEALEAPLYPHDVPLEDTRTIPFSRELFIDREDFMEDPPEDFFRLAPGREVRLRYAYFLRCDEVVRDPRTGDVVELRCTYDPDTRGGSAPDGRKVRGTIHWVSSEQSIPLEVRLYDRLFRTADPDDVPEGGDFLDNLNPDSLEVVTRARGEPWLAGTGPGERVQFERLGYFVTDLRDSRGGSDAGSDGGLVFNRIVTLRDSWARKVARSTADQAEDTKRPKGAEKMPRSEADGGEGRPRGSARGGAREDRDGARRVDPELAVRFERYTAEVGLTEEEADVLSGDRALSDLFEAAVATHDNPRGVASWIVNELPRELDAGLVSESGLEGEALGALVALTDSGALSRTGAREVFSILVARGGDPDALMDAMGLRQVSDPEAFRALVAAAVVDNPEKAAEYRAGKVGLMGFFMGQVMREVGGAADPQVVRALLERELGEGEGA
jgi:glutaminyl-tRNA synthetase